MLAHEKIPLNEVVGDMRMMGVIAPEIKQVRLNTAICACSTSRMLCYYSYLLSKNVFGELLL
jgi:hypothetical protein